MTSIVRGFALALVLAGLLATTRIQANPTSQASVARVSGQPVPVCPPDDPNACHIDQW